MRKVNWAYGYLAALVLVALLADFIAGDKPLVASHEDTLRFPVFERTLPTEDWATVAVEWALWPPIPFRASATDLGQAGYQPPLTPASDHRGIHWLGTDRLGRDTAAGLVSGVRVAVGVGLGSVLISLLLGLPLGAVAGYFGDHGWQLPRGRFMGLVFGLLLGGLYTVGSVAALASGFFHFLLLSTLVMVAAGSSGWLVFGALARAIPWLRRPMGVPIDRLIVILLELTVSIPGLVLLIAVLSYVDRSSLGVVVLTIGILGWTPVARFLRAELMRIRELPYIAAARVGGVGELRLLFRHALPNAIGPVVVVAAFMVGTSILAEAMLSFLGIGVPADQVTWGSILQQSRARPGAWWLAVFPGMLLTLTLLACNSLRQRQ